MGVEACPKCQYVKNHCRCKILSGDFKITEENLPGLMASVALLFPEAIRIAARSLEDLATPPEKAPISTAHTYGAFRGSYVAVYRKPPSEQEVFDAGMRAGREVSWLESHYKNLLNKRH